jgi:hypothetical protein
MADDELELREALVQSLEQNGTLSRLKVLMCIIKNVGTRAFANELQL